MAREKKVAKELTLEEKLQQALLPGEYPKVCVNLQTDVR